MGATKKFRDDHQRLLGMVSEITHLMGGNSQSIETNADQISGKLSQFGGVLKMHLAAEDNFLYPKLVDHDDSKMSETAMKFQNEMGGIADVFKNYSLKWNRQTIKSDPIGFKNDTDTLFNVVGKRISREETELYPIFDAL